MPRRVALALAALLLAAGCTGGSGTRAQQPVGTAVASFDHIVVVVLENHPYSAIIGRADAPFLNSLAAGGALLTRSHGVAYPSEPNYLALFSGSTQGVVDDSCPHSFGAPNLGSALLAAGKTFVGYSEDLPTPGFTGCTSGDYARKHNPWVNFPALPPATNQPLTSFPSTYSALPTVAFVIPNLVNDMHDGTVAQGDQWLRDHLADYARWAPAHNSLLIVTTDEDDRNNGNRITTIFAGAHVKPGRYGTRVDHYGVLRTILDSCRLTPFARAARATPVHDVWTP